MTCREKFENNFDGEYMDFCPSEVGIMDIPSYCSLGNDDNICEQCWGREITEEAVESEPTILDSGDRTRFESGAVRDMRTGKGRFDVMPLEVISDMLGTAELNHDPIVLDIATFMYEHDTAWLEAALDNFAAEAYGGCLYSMFLDVAKHYEEGAIKYDPNNWRRGIPVWCYIDSATRHYMKWRRGDSDENHNLAFVWNLMCCIWEVDCHVKNQ